MVKPRHCTESLLTEIGYDQRPRASQDSDHFPNRTHGRTDMMQGIHGNDFIERAILKWKPGRVGPYQTDSFLQPVPAQVQAGPAHGIPVKIAGYEPARTPRQHHCEPAVSRTNFQNPPIPGDSKGARNKPRCGIRIVAETPYVPVPIQYDGVILLHFSRSSNAHVQLLHVIPSSRLFPIRTDIHARRRMTLLEA
jgi:hypothetical protein